MRGLILPPLATPDPVTLHKPGEFMGSGHSNARTDDEYSCAEQCHRHCGGSPGIAVEQLEGPAVHDDRYRKNFGHRGGYLGRGFVCLSRVVLSFARDEIWESTG